MKYYTFYRESDKFDDILKDINLKKFIDENIRWRNYLRIGIQDTFSDKLASYITLKYGDEMRNEICNDYSPVIDVDYTPKGRKIIS